MGKGKRCRLREPYIHRGQFSPRVSIGVDRRPRGGAADERFQQQEEFLSKHESFFYCLLLVAPVPTWLGELVHSTQGPTMTVGELRL